MIAVESKVPELRFPEFEGEWEKKKLGEVTNWTSGGTPSKENPKYWNGGIPWISASSMRGTKYSRSELTITEEGVRNGSRIAKKGSLLILVRGSMLFKTIPVGIAMRDVSFNQDVKAITTSEELYTDYVLNWFIASEHKILDMVVGTGIGAGKLELQDLKNLRISIPSLPEQQKIATFLSAVDTKIELLTKKKTLLEQYKKSVMRKLFSQQIRFKDDNGKDFPAWEEIELGEATLINPKSKGLPHTFAYIDLESVEKGVLTKRNIVEAINAPSRAQRLLKNSDILFQTVRPYQRNNLFFLEGENYVASTGYAQIRTDNNPKFIYYVLHTDRFVDEVMAKCTGTGYPAINSNDLAKIKIPVPSIPEQKKIAFFLSALDKSLISLNKQIKEINHWKKGLLQNMFC